MPKINDEKIARNPIVLILVFVVIGMGLTLILLYLIFGNLIDAFFKMLNLQGQPNKTSTALTSISYIVTWILTIYSIVVTAIFSYMVYKINNRSLKLSEELKEFEVSSTNENKELTKQSLNISQDLKRIEENRELEEKRSKALIVYYDLQRGFTIIRDLYIKIVLKKNTAVLEQAFFDNGWIENVATLRVGLSSTEIQKIYSLYNSLYTIQKYLETKDESINKYIEKIAKEVFLDLIPLNLIDNFIDNDIEEVLNIENYLIMHKLYKLTFIKTEIIEERKLTILNIPHSEVISGDLVNGEVIFYNKLGYEKLRGHIANGEVISGTFMGYKANEIQYRVEYISKDNKYVKVKGLLENHIFEPLDLKLIDVEFKDNKPFNGLNINIRDNGTISYWGYYKDAERTGIGKFYNNKNYILFDGELVEGYKVRGRLYNKGKLLFDGELKNQMPWSGKCFELDITAHYVKKFTGEIFEGKPINGDGYIFKRSSEHSSLDELLCQEQWEEETQYRYEEEMDSENYEEEQSKYYNDGIRSSYREWEDYLKATWMNGDLLEKELKETNINVYYYPNTRIE